MSEERLTRREVLKKAAYVTPVILTLKANFSFASAGSGDYPDETKTNTSIEYLGRGDEKDKKEKKHERKSTDSDKKNWTNHSRSRP